MSAPHTDIEKQKRRHRGPLVGMAIVLAAVAVLFVGYLSFVSLNGTPPKDTGPKVNDLIGTTIPAQPAAPKANP